MQCPQCRFENRAGVRFCEECGAKLDVACPACGATVPPGRKFCGACGQPLAPAPSPPPKFTAPDTYTPKHLAEKILTSKAALEGERKQVTVLFADLKGSMELLADRGPEEARKLLDPVLERMMEAVHRYEGTVNQVMGDGIMARQGEVWHKAVRYLRQAGAKAVLRSAHREAATCFEQALDALRRLPETPDGIAESLDLRFDLRNALFPLGESGRMGALLDEAEALAEAVGDQRRLGLALTFKVVQLAQAGDLVPAIQAGRRALAIGECRQRLSWPSVRGAGRVPRGRPPLRGRARADSGGPGAGAVR
jgi:class 3 adenylate cyclase